MLAILIWVSISFQMILNWGMEWWRLHVCRIALSNEQLPPPRYFQAQTRFHLEPECPSKCRRQQQGVNPCQRNPPKQIRGFQVLVQRGQFWTCWITNWSSCEYFYKHRYIYKPRALGWVSSKNVKSGCCQCCSPAIWRISFCSLMSQTFTFISTAQFSCIDKNVDYSFHFLSNKHTTRDPVIPALGQGWHWGDFGAELARPLNALEYSPGSKCNSDDLTLAFWNLSWAKKPASGPEHALWWLGWLDGWMVGLGFAQKEATSLFSSSINNNTNHLPVGKGDNRESHGMGSKFELLWLHLWGSVSSPPAKHVQLLQK